MPNQVIGECWPARLWKRMPVQRKKASGALYHCRDCHHEYGMGAYSRTGCVRCPKCLSPRYVWAMFAWRLGI